MKKWFVLMMAALLLSGCGAEEAMETISDEIFIPAMAIPKEISVELPGEATVSSMESDTGRLYICDDYEIAIETMESGDLDNTIRSVTGYPREELTVMKTAENGIKRYEFVWAAAGEKGERLGRAVILDDGNFHYALSVLRDAEPSSPSQIIWSRVFQSFTLV